jgi:hypothetical protein
MNERIKELAVQAKKYARDYVEDCKHYGYYMEHNEFEVRFEQKFAELIVRECMNIADGQKKQVEDMEVFNEQDANWNRARIQQSQQIVDKIKEHFGVEEPPVNDVDRILRTVRTRS